MKKHRILKSILAAAALGAVSIGSTVALATQEASTDQPQTKPAPQTTTSPAQLQAADRCTQLIGASVQNQQGQQLGKITDLVVDPNSEKVSYCVLSVKHGIFSRQKLLAVPLGAFQQSSDGSYLILNATRQNLAQASGLNRNEWPSGAIPAWGAELGQEVELPPIVITAPPTGGQPPNMGITWCEIFPRTASDGVDFMHDFMQYGYTVK